MDGAPDSDNSEGDNADHSLLTPMDVDDDDNDHKSSSRERGASGSAAPPAKRQAKKQGKHPRAVSNINCTF